MVKTCDMLGGTSGAGVLFIHEQPIVFHIPIGAHPIRSLVLPPTTVTFGSHVNTFFTCVWHSRIMSLVQCSEYTIAIREHEPGLDLVYKTRDNKIYWYR
jgi:hypothetical protein